MTIGYTGNLILQDFAEQSLERVYGGRLGEATRASAVRALESWWARSARLLGPASPLRTVFDAGVAPPLEVLGFSVRHPRAVPQSDMLIAEASSGAGRAAYPLVVTPWGQPLDTAWRVVAREGLAQQAGWVLCANGREIRLCDAEQGRAQAYLEFDLEHLGDSPLAQVLLWGLVRPDALEGLTRQVAGASTRHGATVAASLRHGVHDALGLLLDGLTAARTQAGQRRTDLDLGPASALDQALIIVYRILFLLFAESRALVPTWHPIYRDGYTVEALRAQAERPGCAAGLWEGLQALSRLAHAGCRAGTLTVTPFNGRLFSPAHAPLADWARLDDHLVARALVSLTTHDGGGRRVRICFRDLGVEQLGAVYESVLDCEPVADAADLPAESAVPASVGRTACRVSPRRVALVRRRDLRKSTGTFYTPRVMTEGIVQRTLQPLVEYADPDDILKLRVLDPAMGSGAFLVAACRFLASAYEHALVRDRGIFAADVTDADRAGFRRLVAQRCLYGADLNPMAVQVARLSMWLATLAEGRPLSFLDHRLVCGDSVAGASLEDIARQPPGRGSAAGRPLLLPLFAEDLAGPAMRLALPVRTDLAMRPDDSADDVRRKERLLADMSRPEGPLGSLKRLADLWCACWFWTDKDPPPPSPAAFGELALAIRGASCALPDTLRRAWLDTAARVAARHRFLHWSLEFPEVFFDGDGSASPRGGFDAILGNPPWDMLRGDSGEPAAREARRDTAGRLTRFVHQSGVYGACRDGHPNQYQLFVERAIRLLRPDGRLGFLLPWGLASDHGSAALRRLLLERCAVDALVGFENADAIFPIHRGVRFLVVTATAGRPTSHLPCCVGMRHPDALALSVARPDRESCANAQGVVFTPALLERLSGPGLAFPYIRRQPELAMVERVSSAFPALADGRGWGARFGRELNATDDRACFTRVRGGMPVIEGKHIDPFRVRIENCTRWVSDAAVLPSPKVRAAVTHPRLAYRDVASSTNRLTLIAAVLPAGSVSVHTVYCLKTRLHDNDQAVLCALLNSLAANYLVRLWVTTHVGTATVERLPVPRLPAGGRAHARMRSLAVRLARGEGESGPAYADVQALALRVFGIEEGEVPFVLDSFPLIDIGVREAIAGRFREVAYARTRVYTRVDSSPRRRAT